MTRAIQRRLRSTAVVSALVLFVSIMSVARPTVALAAACSGPDVMVGGGWTSTLVTGVRAPIKYRSDGTLCDASSNQQPAFTADYIGIQSGKALVQIGFIHYKPFGYPADLRCRFFEILDSNGNIVTFDPYTCGTDLDGNYTFYRITQFTDPISHLTYYELDQNCGPNYNVCVTVNDSTRIFTSPSAQFESEAWTGCDSHFLGNKANPVALGENTSPDQFQQQTSTGWTSHALNATTTNLSTCTSDYIYTRSSTV